MNVTCVESEERCTAGGEADDERSGGDIPSSRRSCFIIGSPRNRTQFTIGRAINTILASFRVRKKHRMSVIETCELVARH
jgi:hypothetical protein